MSAPVATLADRSEFGTLVVQEMGHAAKKHAPIHSLHEGFGVLMEEVDEYFDQVKLKESKRDYDNIMTELVQIAAVAGRIYTDVAKREATRLQELENLA